MTVPIRVAFPQLSRRNGRSGRLGADAVDANATTPVNSFDDPIHIKQLNNLDLFLHYFSVNPNLLICFFFPISILVLVDGNPLIRWS